MTFGAANRSRDRWRAGTRPVPLYRRTWIQLLVAAGFVPALIGVDLAQHTSPGQRAADLRDYYATAADDLRSCAGGLHDALTAMQAVVTGANRDRPTAGQIAADAEQNCTPVVNTKLYDLATIGPPPSLNSYELQPAASALSQWAYPQAAAAIAAVRVIISAHDAGVVTRTFVELQAQLAAMRATASRAQAAFFTTAHALNTTLPPLDLDSQSALPGTQQP